MRTEALVRNTIAPVSPTLVPSAVLMLPMLGTVILPRVMVCRVPFVYFARALLPVVGLSVCLLVLPALRFSPLLVPAIRVVHNRAPVLVVVVALFPVFLLGTTFFAFVSVLRFDKSGTSKNKAQY